MAGGVNCPLHLAKAKAWGESKACCMGAGLGMPTCRSDELPLLLGAEACANVLQYVERARHVHRVKRGREPRDLIGLGVEGGLPVEGGPSVNRPQQAATH